MILTAVEKVALNFGTKDQKELSDVTVEEANEYIAQGHANVWVVEMGSEAENGRFDDFMARFGPARLAGDTHSFTYDSPSLGRMSFGWGQPLVVEGHEIPLHGCRRYDAPFCRAEFGATRYEIDCGGARAALDFARHERLV